MSRDHLFLVRHGRTALNADGRLRGLADPVLDSVGVMEADATARALAGRGIDRVVSSSLQRAVATASAIAARAHVDLVVERRFDDRDYGPWTGQPRDDVVQQFGTLDAAPGVEPVAAVLRRVRPAVDAVVAARPGRSIAVVTHDAVIRPLLGALVPGLGERLRELRVETGSWAELERRAGGWSVVAVDQVPADREPADDQETAGLGIVQVDRASS